VTRLRTGPLRIFLIPREDGSSNSRSGINRRCEKPALGDSYGYGKTDAHICAYTCTTRCNDTFSTESNIDSLSPRRYRWRILRNAYEGLTRRKKKISRSFCLIRQKRRNDACQIASGRLPVIFRDAPRDLHRRRNRFLLVVAFHLALRSVRFKFSSSRIA